MTSFYLVAGLTFALVSFGLVMMASASAIDSVKQSGSPWYLFIRQAIFAVAGLAAMYLAMRLSSPRCAGSAGRRCSSSIVLLMAVLIPGIGVMTFGSRRWIDLGPLHVQPSEIGKVAFLLWGAHMLMRRGRLLNTWRGLLLPLTPGLAILVGLVVIEPDLGTTVTYFIIFLALLWFVGCPWQAVLRAGAGCRPDRRGGDLGRAVPARPRHLVSSTRSPIRA